MHHLDPRKIKPNLWQFWICNAIKWLAPPTAIHIARNAMEIINFTVCSKNKHNFELCRELHLYNDLHQVSTPPNTYTNYVVRSHNSHFQCSVYWMEIVQNATHDFEYFIVEVEIEFYSRIKAFRLSLGRRGVQCSCSFTYIDKQHMYFSSSLLSVFFFLLNTKFMPFARI